MADANPGGNAEKIVDRASMQELLSAFVTATNDYERAHTIVQSSRDRLPSVWNGAAANAYDGALGQWQDGFNKVRQGLAKISDEMAAFAKETQTTEDDNVISGAWADG